jgi:hypothetical protein
MKNTVLYFMSSFLGSLFFTVFGYYLLWIHQFNVLGFSSAIILEKQHAEVVFSSLSILIITLIVTIVFYFKVKKSIALAVGLPGVISLAISIAIIPHYLDKENYCQKFNKEVWMKERPIKMMQQLNEDKSLLNLTKAKVVEKIGDGDSCNYGDENTLIYFSPS